MDATATPRGISLAVGELGARGRPINKQCTAVRISSTVNGDMCGTCQADCSLCRPLRETPATHGSCFAREEGPGDLVAGTERARFVVCVW